MCFDFLYEFRPKHFSLSEVFSEIFCYMHIGFHINYPLFLSYFIKLESSGQSFEILKYQI